jgi:hypothetical protein
MPRIFNTIRQRLLKENRFTRYLVYAIGEIVLVVLGILIALQLNNLNDQRKNKEVVRLYYEQILQDLETDRKYIEEMMVVYDTNQVKVERYKALFEEADIPPTRLFANTEQLDWSMRNLRLGSTTISTLQSTGDIKLLPPGIRERAVRLKAFQDQTVKITGENFDGAIGMISYATRHFGSPDLVQRMENQPELLAYTFQEDRQIQAFLALEAAQNMKVFAEEISRKRLETILKDMEELSGMINDELSK